MFIYLVSTGILTGFISSFFGVGGGVLAVPALYWLFPFLPASAVIGTSLGMVFFNALINLYYYRKSGNIPRPRLCLFMGVSMGFGVVASSTISGHLDVNTLKRILALLLFCISVKDIVCLNKKEHKQETFNPDNVPLIPVALISFFSGCIAGITGLGGGIFLIPLFIHILHFPLAKVPVYSNACMACGSFIGILTYMLLPVSEDILWDGFLNNFQVGHVNWGISLILSFGGLLSSRWGVALHRKISAKKTKIFFIVLLLCISFKVFEETL